MSSTFGKILIVSLLIVSFLSSADAQIRRRPGSRKIRQPQSSQVSTVGLRLGNDFTNDILILGGQFWLPAGHFWKLAPSFDYFFTDAGSKWQFNGDLIFKPHPRGLFYLGGGVAVDYSIPENSQSLTTIGGNAFLGLDLGGKRFKSMAPYLQARWTFFEDYDYFSLIGGINLALK